MPRLSALAATLLLAGCGPQVERPPPQFQGDRSVTITFVADADAACRKIKPDAHSGEIYGCAIYSALILPNPCGQTGAYADLVCHELGHANGWRHCA